MWSIICNDCLHYRYPWHHTDIHHNCIDVGKFTCMLYCCSLSPNKNHICVIIYLRSSCAPPPLLVNRRRHLDTLYDVFVWGQKSAISGQRIQPLLEAHYLASGILTNFSIFCHNGFNLSCGGGIIGNFGTRQGRSRTTSIYHVERSKSW